MAKSKQSTKKVATKKAGKSAKTATLRNVEITPTTKLKFAHAREGGGVKTEFVKLVPKTGITAAALQKKGAEELKVPVSRSAAWLPKFVRRGVLQIAAR